MSTTQPEFDPEFEALLAYLKRTRGFDFTGYKRSSLMRRMGRRLQMLNIENYGDYSDYLEVHPEEFSILFDMILINVTSFFRDTPAWDYVATDIIPQIIAAKRSNEPIRIWSAGCASGEEAYTIAMLMAEALGVEKFRERVKIYASDVDEQALLQARQAAYSSRETAGIPAAMLEKYFERSDQKCVFRKDLRRAVIFGRHDLVQDAPISRIDLLICRNALMYFNAEMQSKVLSRFHFAVNDTGYLFLGKAEMLFTHANLFAPVDLRRRVFRKVAKTTLRDRLLIMTQAGDEESANSLAKHMRFREAAFDATQVAQVVIDHSANVVLANERARNVLGIMNNDLNRSLYDSDLSFRIPELRARIEDVNLERRPVSLKEIEWLTPAGEKRTLDIQILPLFDNNISFLGTMLIFADVTRYKRLQEEIEHSNQELETAYEELQSTNEELETMNEELQSTVEELETTNEELQSTNEELETMNEELQSSNEELQTMNEELRHRTDELNQVNGFLESILTSMRSAVVVVDKDLRIQVWSTKAEDLWGVRENEVEDKNFLGLDIGLPVEQLKAMLLSTLNGDGRTETTILAATNRRGRAIRCRVTVNPLVNGEKHETRGVIMLMEEIEEDH